MYRNVFANNADRNVEMTGGTSALVVNNLIYGWDPTQEATHFGRAGSVIDRPTCAAVVGNVYLRNPEMGESTAAAIEVHAAIPAGSMIYLSDNLAPTLDGVRDESSIAPFVDEPPIWLDDLVISPASLLTKPILGTAGARPADRDDVDVRVINDIDAGTGTIIDSQGEVGGWPKLEKTRRQLDLPADPGGDGDRDGYTNLEEWLNKMAAAVEHDGRAFLPRQEPRLDRSQQRTELAEGCMR